MDSLTEQEKKILNNILTWYAIAIKNITAHSDLEDWESTEYHSLEVIKSLTQFVTHNQHSGIKETLNYTLHYNLKYFVDWPEDRPFSFNNETKKRSFTIGTVNINKGKPYMYIEPWDKEVINGHVLVFEIPVMSQESIQTFEDCFERFMKLETDEEIALFDSYLKELNKK